MKPSFRVKILTLALLCLASLATVRLSAQQTGLLEFTRAQSERRYQQVPHEVLAFYYTWYGRPERHGQWVHWGKVTPETHDISAATHYPAKGAYDSHDPDLIDWHIDLAKQNGVTGFISTWWGQGTFDDRAFTTLLDRAAKKDFKVTIYWETAPGKDQGQIEKAINDLTYVLQRYGQRTPFLKVQGKPVIFVYGRVMQQAPPGSWPAIITGARAKAGDFLLIADGYQEGYARTFDGIHTYNICGWVKDLKPDELRKLSANSFAQAVKLAKDHSRISCLTIIPGYDDTKIRKPGLKAERQAGETYRVLWQEAIKADPDWVLITSWNEWHEGSEIEPSWEDGDKYIKLTGEFATRFLSKRFSKVTPAAQAKLAPGKARRLQQLYAGCTIGILPDYGGQAPFWLAEAGLKTRELSWSDLLDPAILNPRAIPLLLHAGGEHYVGTVKTENDVQQALQRYLSQGGFLISIPHLAWPFYYDDSAGKPAPISSQIGLPVAGGWERPPDASLSFNINKALPGIPRKIAFPTGGDLRWRAAKPEAVNKEDLYLSLAELKDTLGKSYGDGLAYVEHRTPPLRNGKTLYVWMRMPDALGVNDGLFAIFQFAGEKRMGAAR